MTFAQLCNSDVVVDTNVLAHCDNAASGMQLSALEVLSQIREKTAVRMALDDQGKAKPDLSTSLLASEYQATLPPQGFGISLFTYLLAAQRITFAERPSQSLRKSLERLIPRNKNDRVVLGAACGTVDKVLISNDYSDFSEVVREAAEKNFQVHILDSDAAAGSQATVS